MTASPATDTKDRILDTAERLFAIQGYSVTSLRNITSEAGVNLAAINYHFNSKEGLLLAVLHRRIDPVNRERLDRLDALEASGSATVDRISRAMLEPALRMRERYGIHGEYGLMILGKLHSEPAGVPDDLFARLFRKVSDRFIAAFREAVPTLPPEEVFWRMHFVIGAMAHTLVFTGKIKEMTCGLCDGADTDAMVERLVAFASAGITGPLPRPAGKEVES